MSSFRKCGGEHLRLDLGNACKVDGSRWISPPGQLLGKLLELEERRREYVVCKVGEDALQLINMVSEHGYRKVSRTLILDPATFWRRVQRALLQIWVAIVTFEVYDGLLNADAVLVDPRSRRSARPRNTDRYIVPMDGHEFWSQSLPDRESIWQFVFEHKDLIKRLDDVYVGGIFDKRVGAWILFVGKVLTTEEEAETYRTANHHRCVYRLPRGMAVPV